MHITFTCSYCFEPNDHWVDPSAGRVQSYTEDCQVCCRPNVLHLAWDDWQVAYSINTEPELG